MARIRLGTHVGVDGLTGVVVGHRPQGMVDIQVDGESFVARKREAELRRMNPRKGSSLAAMRREVTKMLHDPPSSWKALYRRSGLSQKPSLEEFIDIVRSKTPSGRSAEMHYRKEMGEGSHVPPQAVRAEALHGLRLSYENNYTSQSGVGLARAVQLAVSASIDDLALTRMDSYLDRHWKDQFAQGSKSGGYFGDDDNPSRGYMAWLNWGGDSAVPWVLQLKPTGRLAKRKKREGLNMKSNPSFLGFTWGEDTKKKKAKKASAPAPQLDPKETFQRAIDLYHDSGERADEALVLASNIYGTGTAWYWLSARRGLGIQAFTSAPRAYRPKRYITEKDPTPTVLSNLRDYRSPDLVTYMTVDAFTGAVTGPFSGAEVLPEYKSNPVRDGRDEYDPNKEQFHARVNGIYETLMAKRLGVDSIYTPTRQRRDVAALRMGTLSKKEVEGIVDRAFAIATAQEQKEGKLYKGSNEPTLLGAMRSQERRADRKKLAQNQEDYETMLRLRREGAPASRSRSSRRKAAVSKSKGRRKLSRRRGSLRLRANPFTQAISFSPLYREYIDWRAGVGPVDEDGNPVAPAVEPDAVYLIPSFVDRNGYPMPLAGQAQQIRQYITENGGHSVAILFPPEMAGPNGPKWLNERAGTRKDKETERMVSTWPEEAFSGTDFSNEALGLSRDSDFVIRMEDQTDARPKFFQKIINASLSKIEDFLEAEKGPVYIPSPGFLDTVAPGTRSLPRLAGGRLQSLYPSYIDQQLGRLNNQYSVKKEESDDTRGERQQPLRLGVKKGFHDVILDGTKTLTTRPMWKSVTDVITDRANSIQRTYQWLPSNWKNAPPLQLKFMGEYTFQQLLKDVGGWSDYIRQEAAFIDPADGAVIVPRLSSGSEVNLTQDDLNEVLQLFGLPLEKKGLDNTYAKWQWDWFSGTVHKKKGPTKAAIFQIVVPGRAETFEDAFNPLGFAPDALTQFEDAIEQRAIPLWKKRVMGWRRLLGDAQSMGDLARLYRDLPLNVRNAYDSGRRKAKTPEDLAALLYSIVNDREAWKATQQDWYFDIMNQPEIWAPELKKQIVDAGREWARTERYKNVPQQQDETAAIRIREWLNQPSFEGITRSEGVPPSAKRAAYKGIIRALDRNVLAQIRMTPDEQARAERLQKLKDASEERYAEFARLYDDPTELAAVLGDQSKEGIARRRELLRERTAPVAGEVQSPVARLAMQSAKEVRSQKQAGKRSRGMREIRKAGDTRERSRYERTGIEQIVDFGGDKKNFVVMTHPDTKEVLEGFIEYEPTRDGQYISHLIFQDYKYYPYLPSDIGGEWDEEGKRFIRNLTLDGAKELMFLNNRPFIPALMEEEVDEEGQVVGITEYRITPVRMNERAREFLGGGAQLALTIVKHGFRDFKAGQSRMRTPPTIGRYKTTDTEGNEYESFMVFWSGEGRAMKALQESWKGIFRRSPWEQWAQGRGQTLAQTETEKHTVKRGTFSKLKGEGFVEMWYVEGPLAPDGVLLSRDAHEAQQATTTTRAELREYKAQVKRSQNLGEPLPLSPRITRFKLKKDAQKAAKKLDEQMGRKVATPFDVQMTAFQVKKGVMDRGDGLRAVNALIAAFAKDNIPFVSQVARQVDLSQSTTDDVVYNRLQSDDGLHFFNFPWRKVEREPIEKAFNPRLARVFVAFLPQKGITTWPYVEEGVPSPLASIQRGNFAYHWGQIYKQGPSRTGSISEAWEAAVEAADELASATVNLQLKYDEIKQRMGDEAAEAYIASKPAETRPVRRGYGEARQKVDEWLKATGLPDMPAYVTLGFNEKKRLRKRTDEGVDVSGPAYYYPYSPAGRDLKTPEYVIRSTTGNNPAITKSKILDAASALYEWEAIDAAQREAHDAKEFARRQRLEAAREEYEYREPLPPIFDQMVQSLTRVEKKKRTARTPGERPKAFELAMAKDMVETLAKVYQRHMRSSEEEPQTVQRLEPSSGLKMRVTNPQVAMLGERAFDDVARVAEAIQQLVDASAGTEQPTILLYKPKGKGNPSVLNQIVKALAAQAGLSTQEIPAGKYTGIEGKLAASNLRFGVSPIVVFGQSSDKNVNRILANRSSDIANRVSARDREEQLSAFEDYAAEKGWEPSKNLLEEYQLTPRNREQWVQWLRNTYTRILQPVFDSADAGPQEWAEAMRTAMELLPRLEATIRGRLG